MHNHSWGKLLYTMGAVNLIALAIGSAFSNDCWFGTFMLGLPLLVFGAKGRMPKGDMEHVVGMFAFATMGQGLICFVVGPTILTVFNVAIIAAGIFAEANPQYDDDREDDDPVEVAHGNHH